MELPHEIVSPDYAIIRFTDQIFKVIRFNRSDLFLPGLRSQQKEPATYEEKLDASFSRTRRIVMELGLCNPWEYFFTATLDQTKRDRYDLVGFNKTISQFIRDMRKKYKCDIDYLLVPEKHKDGAWHMHGLLRGIPCDRLTPFVRGVHPDKLCNRGYLNWPDYAQRFGFCSLGAIRDPVAVGFYVCKYVAKDLCDRKSELGAHLYYASQGLSRAVRVSEVIGNCSELNAFLTHHYEFCSTGLTKVSDGLDWTFPLQYDDTTVYLEAFPAPPECRETRKLDRMIEAVEQLAFMEV